MLFYNKGKPMLKTKTLYRLIIYSIVFILILTLGFTFIVLNIAQNEFNEKVGDLRQTYTNDKKELLKNDVDMVLSFIAFYVEKNQHKKSQKQLQQEVLHAILKLRKHYPNEYFFIYDFQGNLIHTPSLNTHLGDNFLHAKDRNGSEFIKNLIDISKQKDGGFVQYGWFNPHIKSYAQKLSYANSYRPWKWTIGKGIYIHKIDELIKQKEQKYHKNIEHYIYQIAILSLLLALYSIFIYKNATRLIIKDVKAIREYFESSNQKEPLDTDRLNFGEFKIIAKYASNAIKTIQTKRAKLEAINKNLELIVSQKTSQLSSLVESQKKFIKYSVHEINTPLSIIRNNIDLFKMKSPKNAYLTNIESGAKIIQCIYEELSYLIKKDKIEYKKEYLNFSQILHDRVEFFKEIANSNMLTFSNTITPDIYIYFNQTMLERLIDNNLSNAIKYSFASSYIKIDLKYSDHDKIDLCINTHSKKIEDLTKVFDGFYREDSARGGFGLGLSMVKDICDKNEARIELHSNDNETKFTYRFNINENTTT